MNRLRPRVHDSYLATVLPQDSALSCPAVVGQLERVVDRVPAVLNEMPLHQGSVVPASEEELGRGLKYYWL